MDPLKENFFALLRLGLGMEGQAPSEFSLTPEEWAMLYEMATRQSVLGVAYAGIQRLPKDAQPPMELAFQWASEAETICGHNRLVNGVAARLTELFAAEGRRSAILKGPANARLYPDPGMRQCGDIDIWVEGGRAEIESLLLKKGMLHVPDSSVPRPESSHHFHLPEPIDGVEVEVHFRPSSGNQNPFSNARLQIGTGKPGADGCWLLVALCPVCPGHAAGPHPEASLDQRHRIQAACGLPCALEVFFCCRPGFCEFPFKVLRAEPDCRGVDVGLAVQTRPASLAAAR